MNLLALLYAFEDVMRHLFSPLWFVPYIFVYLFIVGLFLFLLDLGAMIHDQKANKSNDKSNHGGEDPHHQQENEDSDDQDDREPLHADSGGANADDNPNQTTSNEINSSNNLSTVPDNDIRLQESSKGDNTLRRRKLNAAMEKK